MGHLLRSAPAAVQHASVARYAGRTFGLFGADLPGHTRASPWRGAHRLRHQAERTRLAAGQIVILSVATEIEVHAARAVPLHIGPSTPTGYWPRRLSVRADRIEAQKTDAYVIRRRSSVLPYRKWHAT